MSLTFIQARVDGLVRDAGNKVSPTDRDEAIASAVVAYSEDRPRAIPEDVTADGSRVLPLPSGWVAGESRLLGIEYPVGLVPPEAWPATDFSLYEAPGGEQILMVDAPAAGQTVRVRFGVPHVLDATTDTIPAKHAEAVAYYAAAILCEVLASQYADNKAPAISADRVDQRSQSSTWRALAKDYRVRYGEIVGISETDSGAGPHVTAASTVVNFDMEAGDGGRPIFRRR
jgi:hypothetical protein